MFGLRRWRVLLCAVLTLSVANAAFAAAGHLLNAKGRAYVAPVGQRDAAGRGDGHQLNPLIAEGYAGKTGSDSAAVGRLAFFTT
ncbi:MAG: hypothetical protein ABSG43_11550 [Solirubrobacteraceae bacterium]